MNNVEFSNLVGRSKNYTSGILNDRYKPPLDDLKQWSKVLGLSPEEYKQFEEEALLAHAPPPLVDRYRSMKRALEARGL